MRLFFDVAIAFLVVCANAGAQQPSFADVVVLDSDLFSIAPEKIKDVAVRYTMVGGKVVYEVENN